MFANDVFIVAIFPIVISPLAMLLLRLVLEGGMPGGMFNPRTQSWAFLFGDSLALPLALGSAAYAVRGVSWFESWWWVVVSVFLGGVVAACFRILEESSYSASGDADRLYSATKLWHDFAVYTSVGFLLIWIGIPAILTGTTAGWLTLSGFLLWLAFGVCDMVRGLKPAYLHPRVQDTRLRKLFR